MLNEAHLYPRRGRDWRKKGDDARRVLCCEIVDQTRIVTQGVTVRVCGFPQEEEALEKARAEEEARASTTGTGAKATLK